jgi:hypothetical protein
MTITVEAPETGVVKLVGPHDGMRYRLFRYHNGEAHFEHDGAVLVIAYRDAPRRSFPQLLLLPQSALVEAK